MKEILVTKEYAGGRMDKLVLKFLDRAPAGFVYKMLRKKNIVLNEKKAKGSEILKENDRICLYLADETIAKFQSADAKAQTESRISKTDLESFRNRIVFEDDNLLAVNKPEDMLSQKANRSDRSLNDLVQEYLSSTALFTPGISNRLDRNTSGIVLAGKNPAAARELNRAIRERDLEKYYLCLVKGRIETEETLDGWLVKNEKTNRVRIVRTQESGGVRIVTSYRPLAEGEGVTLLEVKLVTGKSHQIRAHFASVGHPVIGDPKYGDKSRNAQDRKRYGLTGQFLHALRIVFCRMRQPLSYLNGSEIKAALPELFARILKDEIPDYPEVPGTD